MYTDSDKEWTIQKPERSHFYFLVEFLLNNSGYAVGDLLKDVENYEDCHHHCISYQVLGLVSFLLFEFMYSGNSMFCLRYAVLTLP